MLSLSERKNSDSTDVLLLLSKPIRVTRQSTDPVL